MVVALGPGRFYGSSLPRPQFYSDVKLSSDGKRVDPPLGVLDPLLSWAEEAHWSMGGVSFERHRLQGRIEGSVKMLRVQEERKEKAKQKLESGKRSVGSVVEGVGVRRKLRKTTALTVVPEAEELPLPEEEKEPETEPEMENGEGESGDSLSPVPPPAPVARVTRSGKARRKHLRRALLDDGSDGEANICETMEATPLSPAASDITPSVPADESVSGTSPRRLTKKRTRKLSEEFDRAAAADSPAVIPASSAPAAASAVKRSEKKISGKEKGKAADASSPKRNSVRISPAKSFRRPRMLAA